MHLSEELINSTVLKAQLEGDARRAIAGFPLSNGNYEQAVKLLKEHFGQPSKIISAHMQALIDIVSPTDQLASFQRFHDTSKTHVRGLESLGRSPESYGDLLVPIIMGKLPSELKKNLARGHNNPEWKFQELRDAILREIRILEAGTQLTPTIGKPYENVPTVTGSLHTQSVRNCPRHVRPNPSETIKKCFYCKGSHPSFNCTVVTNVQERWSRVKSLRHCFNCLGNHKSSSCQSRFRCHKCRGKHHTSLCLGSTPPNHDHPSSVNPASQSPREPIREPPAPVHASLPPITQANTTAASAYISLLKTAVAIIRHDRTHCDANILFDEGAQRSFITQSLADQLDIQSTQIEPISLPAFGAHTSSYRQLPVATVNIVTPLREEIPVRVLIIDQITTPLENRSRNQLQDLPHLKNLKLAHPVTSDEKFCCISSNWCRPLLGIGEGRSHPRARSNSSSLQARLSHLRSSQD